MTKPRRPGRREIYFVTLLKARGWRHEVTRSGTDVLHHPDLPNVTAKVFRAEGQRFNVYLGTRRLYSGLGAAFSATHAVATIDKVLGEVRA